MVRFYKSFLLFIFFGLSAAKAQISVSAFTDSSEFKVGDFINYHLEIKADKNIKLFIPSVKDSVKDLEFIKELPPVQIESGEKRTTRYDFIFSKYDSSAVTIPSYKIFYTVGADTARKPFIVNPVNIVVKTLAVNQSQEIMDVKPPVKIPFNWLIAGIIALGVLGLLVAGYFIYKYYKKKNAVTETEKKYMRVPPHEAALSDLRRLEEKKLWQQGKIKEYHSEITEIIRRYFENRFGFLALEMTSGEVIKSLSENSETDGIINHTNSFLSNADLVKFAKFQPMPSVNEEMMKQAYDIVTKTKIVVVKNDAEVKSVG